MPLPSSLQAASSWVGYDDADGRRVWDAVGTPWYGDPWCAAFVQMILADAGVGDQLAAPSPYYVPSIEAFARARGTFVDSDTDWSARPGDVALFDWNVDGVDDHIGLVEAIGPGWVRTIEGNTSPGNASDGGTVARMIRYPSQVRGWVRIDYAAAAARPLEEDDMQPADLMSNEFAEWMRQVLFIQPPLPNSGVTRDAALREMLITCKSLESKVDALTLSLAERSKDGGDMSEEDVQRILAAIHSVGVSAKEQMAQSLGAALDGATVTLDTRAGA